VRVDHERFRKILIAAQEERHLRGDLVKHPDGSEECGWAAFEREVMHSTVNQARTESGLSEIPVENVRRVEGLAEGHSDYTSKFALYCAELAADIPRPAP
jgi:hypothetical protein